jgi:hypothetical protein
VGLPFKSAIGRAHCPSRFVASIVVAVLGVGTAASCSVALRCDTICFMKTTVVRLDSNLLEHVATLARSGRRSVPAQLSLIVEEWMNGNQDVDVVRGAGSGETGAVERGGDDAAVPVLPKAKGGAKRLHKVQPVRDQLATGNGLEHAAALWPCPTHPGKSYRNGAHLGCIECERGKVKISTDIL